jgi:hypothetical protein
MPDRNGLPQQGEEVLFPDGSTETIKRYMRTRVIGYTDSELARAYEEAEASVPVSGHVVEMAQPRRNEFVTVITYLPSGFWQPLNPATTVSSPTAPSRDAADAAISRYEAQFEDPMSPAAPLRGRLGLNAFWRKQWVYYMGFYFFGMVVGGAIVWLATHR